MAKIGNDDRLDKQKLMICLDVDGTIVNHQGQISQRVRDAARAVVERGHEVVISTGRSLGAALPVMEELGIDHGYVVVSNGGVLAKVTGSDIEVIHREVFDPSAALKALWKQLPKAKYALENERGEFLSNESFGDASFGAETKVVDFDELLENKAVRVVVFSTDNTAEEFGHAVQGLGLSGVTLLGRLDRLAGYRRRRHHQGQRPGATARHLEVRPGRFPGRGRWPQRH